MEELSITSGIQFSSFIALNRYLNPQIFKDSKLLTLIIYIALRVKRSNDTILDSLDCLDLNTGEFIIGRISTVNNTDLTEQEYKTRIERLVTLKIIELVEITNKYSKYKWLENSFIDVNLERQSIQLINQQSSSDLTTNNNTNNANKKNSFNTNNTNLVNNNDVNEQYKRILNVYMKYKGIELKGYEVDREIKIVKDMLASERTTEEIINCIKWFKDHEADEEFPWVKFWNLGTVQKKLPEYLAGKFKSWIDEEFPEYEKPN